MSVMAWFQQLSIPFSLVRLSFKVDCFPVARQRDRIVITSRKPL